MAEKARPVEGLSFEAALAELEQVVARLEKGEVPLEESLALYERGAALRRHCDERLKAAEARVAEITQGPDGSVDTRGRWTFPEAMAPGPDRFPAVLAAAAAETEAALAGFLPEGRGAAGGAHAPCGARRRQAAEGVSGAGECGSVPGAESAGAARCGGCGVRARLQSGA